MQVHTNKGETQHSLTHLTTHYFRFSDFPLSSRFRVGATHQFIDCTLRTRVSLTYFHSVHCKQASNFLLHQLKRSRCFVRHTRRRPLCMLKHVPFTHVHLKHLTALVPTRFTLHWRPCKSLQPTTNETVASWSRATRFNSTIKSNAIMLPALSHFYLVCLWYKRKQIRSPACSFNSRKRFLSFISLLMQVLRRQLFPQTGYKSYKMTLNCDIHSSYYNERSSSLETSCVIVLVFAQQMNAQVQMNCPSSQMSHHLRWSVSCGSGLGLKWRSTLTGHQS